MAQEGHGKGPEEIPITIDDKPFKVDAETEGRVLYELGNVGADFELWIEARGQGNDILVENSTTKVMLKPGNVLYTARKKLNPGA